MEKLNYTSVYQMSYFFIKVATGDITSSQVKESLGPFVMDLENDIQKDSSSIQAVKESIQSELEDGGYSAEHIDSTLKLVLEFCESILGRKSNYLISFLTKTFLEVKIAQ